MIIAPTSTIPWIELAPDISGVWSVAGTLLMTSKPTRIASTKIVSAVSSSVTLMRAGLRLAAPVAARGASCRGLDDLAAVGDDGAVVTSSVEVDGGARRP